MAHHWMAVWDAYRKAHKADLPLISHILTAGELASPELEAMVEQYLSEAAFA